MLLLVFRARLRSDFDDLAEAGNLREDTKDMDVVVAVESGETADLARLEAFDSGVVLGKVILPWGLFSISFLAERFEGGTVLPTIFRRLCVSLDELRLAFIFRDLTLLLFFCARLRSAFGDLDDAFLGDRLEDGDDGDFVPVTGFRRTEDERFSDGW